MLNESIIDGKIFQCELIVPDDAIDQNGHVNNVVYVQWMQDVAVRHSELCGGTSAMENAGATWVVRSHTINYLSPAFEGDRIEAFTWVVDFQRIRSIRRYKFVRVSDGKICAKGQTDWVFVNAENGRPRTIPEEVKVCFSPAPDFE